MILVGNPSFQMLERSLDAASLRQNVIANNVANVDTPYFKRSDVKFEELLQQQMNGVIPLSGRRTDPRHFQFGSSTAQSIEPQLVKDEKSVINNNNNNVDIDSEMTAMAKNQLRYNVLIQQMNHELKQARTAIDRR